MIKLKNAKGWFLPLDDNFHLLKTLHLNNHIVTQIHFWLTICKPKKATILFGGQQEQLALQDLLVHNNTFIPLNPQKRPNSFYCRSNPMDTARSQQCTFICTKEKQMAGITNQWQEPRMMKDKLEKLFANAMKGRHAFIIGYLLGPPNSDLFQVGVEITDSAYVAYSMMQLTRVGSQYISYAKDIVFGLHSVGKPLNERETDIAWPCNEHRVIAHFPEDREIFSFGSGYGGNALLAKKCHGLRLASYWGYQQGYLAEHMLIISITNPEEKKHYITAAFPSACGKTNLALLRSKLPGWKVETIGDDIAWLYVKEGRLWAINPEYGFFGVAPGTNFQTNPAMMETISKNTVFTNVALTKDRDVWWEGMSNPPEVCYDWKGQLWKPGSQLAAHPNSRFTVNIKNCPNLDENWKSSQGVPISAIVFGGRRASLIPLVFEAKSWQSGIFYAAGLSSQATAAQEGKIGEQTRDSFAMQPFCGYNMANYFAHWNSFQKKIASSNLPKIFLVNWFRQKNGKYLWSGFTENMRVIQWIFEQLENSENAKEHVLGLVPKQLNQQNLPISEQDFAELFSVSASELQQEIEDLKQYFSLFGADLPSFLDLELKRLQNRCQQL